jgi:hypothetical protein
MRVTVRFVDGEELKGTAESVSLDGGGFTLVGTEGNTRSIWVGPGAIKYVMIQPARKSPPADTDPRGGENLPKLVLHFLDGEVVRTYQDRFFAPQAGGFALRLWDDRSRQLVKAIVAGASLKGIFTVDEWDSRSDQPSRTGASQRESEESAPVPDAADQETLANLGPEVEAGTAEPVPADQPPVAAPAEEVAETAIMISRGAPPVETDVAATALEVEIATEEPAVVPGVAAENVGMIVRGDAEERRPTFHSGLGRRAKLVQTLSPEEERHLQLMARISEVLGSIGPGRGDPEEEELTS